MSVRAGYLVQADPGGPRDQLDFNPEFSRRARGFPVYAAVARSAGPESLNWSSAAVRTRADSARRSPSPRLEVLNDVVLNQVLVRFTTRPVITTDRRAR